MNLSFCSTLHTKAMIDKYESKYLPLADPKHSWRASNERRPLVLSHSEGASGGSSMQHSLCFRKFFHAAHSTAACWDKSLGHSYFMGGWNRGYSVRGKILGPFLIQGNNFRLPVITIFPHDALWCSLAGIFWWCSPWHLRRFPILSLQSFLAENLKQKDLVPKMPFSLYLLKLEMQKVEITQEQNHIAGANI